MNIGAKNFCSKNILTARGILIVIHYLCTFILEHHTQPRKMQLICIRVFAPVMINACFSFLVIGILYLEYRKYRFDMDNMLFYGKSRV